MSFDESLADGQTQAGASRMSLTPVSCPEEPLENMRQLVGSNTRPVVRDGDDHLPISTFGCDMYLTFAVCLRVRDQVGENHLDTRPIDINRRKVVEDYRGDRDCQADSGAR